MEKDTKESLVNVATALAAVCSTASIASEVPANSEYAKQNAIDAINMRRTFYSKTFNKKKKARKTANKSRRVNRRNKR